MIRRLFSHETTLDTSICPSCGGQTNNLPIHEIVVDYINSTRVRYHVRCWQMMVGIRKEPSNDNIRST